MPRFYKDLKAAGIAREDERGHVVVFHSLRHTLATWLWDTGANPRVIQELMRHASIELTANRYTDTLGLELRKASDDLPTFGSAGTKKLKKSAVLETRRSRIFNLTPQYFGLSRIAFPILFST
jgi:hypothetical protein